MLTIHSLSRRLALPCLAAVLVACAPGGTPAGGSVATSAPLGTAAAPTATPISEATQTPRPKALEVADASDDCFDGFRSPDECAGLDMTGLHVGPASLWPELAGDPATQGRLVFLIDFATDPGTAVEFGAYLYLDLDEDPGTGLDMTDLPGIDRLIGATLPNRDTWNQYMAVGGYDAEIVRDESLATVWVMGNSVAFVVDPSLLSDSPDGSPPDAFTLYICSARSIEALDYFNGDQDLHIPQPIIVPADVVAQVQ
jgi:hypothetical protein